MPNEQARQSVINGGETNHAVNRIETFSLKLTFAALSAWTFLAKNQQHFLAVFSQTLKVAAK